MEQNFCQSCGMPLETDEVIGTNADRSKNGDYCVYCFQDGAFTEDVTMEEMIDISLKHMNELYANEPGYDAQKALDNMRAFFPQLKRWQV